MVGFLRCRMHSRELRYDISRYRPCRYLFLRYRCSRYALPPPPVWWWFYNTLLLPDSTDSFCTDLPPPFTPLRYDSTVCSRFGRLPLRFYSFPCSVLLFCGWYYCSLLLLQLLPRQSYWAWSIYHHSRNLTLIPFHCTRSSPLFPLRWFVSFLRTFTVTIPTVILLPLPWTITILPTRCYCVWSEFLLFLFWHSFHSLISSCTVSTRLCSVLRYITFYTTGIPCRYLTLFTVLYILLPDFVLRLISLWVPAATAPHYITCHYTPPDLHMHYCSVLTVFHVRFVSIYLRSFYHHWSTVSGCLPSLVIVNFTPRYIRAINCHFDFCVRYRSRSFV